jgi:dipeptidyl-peptidase-4
LTKGNWDVTSVYGVDERRGLLFYQAAAPTPLDRQVWCTPLDGGPATLLTPKPGTNSAEFSSTFSFFIHRWSDANTPAFITMNRSTGEVIRVLQDNAALIARMKQYNLSGVEFFSFPTDGDIILNACILKPPDFDPLKKYPVLFSVYGGPGSQTVLNSWRVMSFWNRYLAQCGIIIVNIDPRGTSARGADFKRTTYLQLGKYETEDMISAARYLASLPYVDKARIGVWGWSYGGFMVLNCMTRAADYFSVGVSVAPVTDYRYYDDIYTERFMRTPKENPDGYAENSPIKYVDRFKGKLLLIHGMSDDNVHPQNSYDFMTAMVAADKYFDLQLYPNNNHFMNTGKNTSDHLYRRMTDYILKNLNGE